MPEQDSWTYPGKEGYYRPGPSMVCNAFVCQYVYTTAGRKEMQASKQLFTVHVLLVLASLFCDSDEFDVEVC